MTPNTSLQLSYEFKKRLKQFNLQSLSDRIPSDVIDQYYQRNRSQPVPGCFLQKPPSAAWLGLP
jgi:hypothetical protein